MLGELALSLYAALPAWDDLIYPRLWTSLLLVLALYYCWYQWCFRISPWLYPQQVAEIPYRIPCKHFLDQRIDAELISP
jgi:hypothetical protein